MAKNDPKVKHELFAYGGDFGDKPNSGNFCMNGVVTADRRITAKLKQVKHSYRSIFVEPKVIDLAKVEVLSASSQLDDNHEATNILDGDTGAMSHSAAVDKWVITVKNEYDFHNTSEFDATWRIEKDGKVIQRGAAGNLDVAPWTSKDVSIEFDRIKQESGAEYWFTIDFALKKDTLWAKKGHVVCSEQMRLPFVDNGPEPVMAKGPALKVTKDGEDVTVANKNFNVKFTRATGLPQTLEYNGKKVIKGNFKPNFWHARIDNDPRLNGETIYHSSVRALKNKPFACDVINVEKISDDLVRITSKIVVKNELADMSYDIVWNIYSGGDIHADVNFSKNKGPEALARIGFIFEAPAELNKFTWFGRGPQENCNDRKSGAPVGLYSLPVNEMKEFYEKPQETGNRTDVRWATVTSESGSGLKIAADKPISMKALNWEDSEMDNIGHICDLPDSDRVWVYIDGAHTGVGNGSCGPSTLSQYLCTQNKLKFGFSFSPIE